VVEPSLACQSACGLSGLSWDPSGLEWVGIGVDSPENHTAQEGALGDLDWHLWWNSAGTLQARENYWTTCSDLLAHTLEVCKGDHLYNGYLASKDDHNSWGMCTTSTECKTVITAVFTVMSGMDPHMISGNLGWVLLMSWVGFCQSGLLDFWSVMVRRHDAIEAISFEKMSLLPCLLDCLRHRLSSLLSSCQNTRLPCC
jgi:hypothetical protein